MHKKIFHIPIVLFTLMSLLVNVPVAHAADKTCRDRVNKTFDKLLECVTVDGVRQHQAAFQAIADANGGTRTAGTPGYDASVAYVADTLEAAGYNVELSGFDFLFLPPATLEQTAPITATYETGAFSGSGSGSVTGPVIPVDLALAPPSGLNQRLRSVGLRWSGL